ncbi:MAG: DUF3108 domain-containing protein [Bacteroidetes bacterium]|nr:MAG: DUF3108 domain-containing protein [Bacteroidota bacterium]
MSKKFLLIIFLFAILQCRGQNNYVEPPYKGGETLKYVLYYGWIDGGEALLKITDTIYNNKKVVHSVARARTIKLVEKFYNVKDVYESYFDAKTNLPEKSIRNISENSYKYYNEVTYDREYDSVISLKSGKHAVPKNIQDVLSAFYYLRNQSMKSMKVGQEIKVDTYFSDEVFPLIIRYKGDEIIKTRIGKFNCMKFVPVVEVGRVFKTKDDLKIWITKDENFIPMRVQFDLAFGALKCDLIEYSGIKMELNYLE